MKKIQKKWLLFIITSFVSFFGIGYTLLNKTYSLKENNIYSLEFNDLFSVDSENKYIKYLTIGTNISSVIDGITIVGGNISVRDKDGNIKDNNDVMATGDVLISYADDKVIDEYQLSVMGDSNGDGKLSLLDLAQFREYYVKWVDPNTDTHFPVTNFYEQAFDFNKDGRISIIDLAIMRKTEAGVI